MSSPAGFKERLFLSPTAQRTDLTSEGQPPSLVVVEGLNDLKAVQAALDTSVSIRCKASEADEASHGALSRAVRMVLKRPYPIVLICRPGLQKAMLGWYVYAVSIPLQVFVLGGGAALAEDMLPDLQVGCDT